MRRKYFKFLLYIMTIASILLMYCCNANSSDIDENINIIESKSIEVKKPFAPMYDITFSYMKNYIIGQKEFEKFGKQENIVTEEVGYTEEDLDMLSRIINAEAGGESAECMLLVGNVVLNRVTNKQYPNTIKDVIYDKKYGVQYTPVVNGHINKIPSDTAIECAKKLLEGERFCPENVIYQAEFKQGDGVYKKVDGMYFCYEN